MLVDVESRAEGVVERDGWRLRWQEFGEGPSSVLLLPTWSIVHTDFWRHQVPELAKHHRVVTFDGLGNGASDRPVDPAAYGDLLVAGDAVAVLDAVGVRSAAVMGVSQGGPWALALAAQHPNRVDAAVFIAPNVPLAPAHPVRAWAVQRFDEELDGYDGWSRWNRHSWLSDYEGFLRFFFSQCFTEPASESHIAHFVDMGMQTSPEVLLATMGTPEQNLAPDMAQEFARQLGCPSLVIHGDADAITPVARGTELARLASARLVVLPGSGHEPQCRNPEIVNPLLLSFLAEHRGGSR